MKKRFIFPIILISEMLVTTGCSNSKTLTSNDYANDNNPSAVIEMNFSAKKNRLVQIDSPKGTTSAKVYSENNDIYCLDYQEVYFGGGDKWQRINRNGYFRTLIKHDDKNLNKIRNMQSLTFDFDVEGLDYTITFSKDGNFDGKGEWSKNYKTKKGKQVIGAECHPNYFCFQAGNRFIDINNLKITYGGNAQADVDWWNQHTFYRPVIDKSTSTVQYGLYPKNYVGTSGDSTNELVKELDKTVEDLGGVDDNEYFWYKDEYYVKNTGNPSEKVYTFNNNIPVINGTVYYFKCEPISWHISTVWNQEYYDTYFIECIDIIDAHRYSDDYVGEMERTDYQNETGLAHPNNYKFSEIRSWLNTSFYDKAFYLDTIDKVSNVSEGGVNNGIHTTENVDNPWISDLTIDKIYLDCYQDYNEVDVFQRTKKVSDYAISNGAYVDNNTRYGRYWTRSPCYLYDFYAWGIDYDGNFIYDYSYYSFYGVSPSLRLLFNKK